MATATMGAEIAPASTQWVNGRTVLDALATHYHRLHQLVAEGKIRARKAGPNAHTRYALSDALRLAEEWASRREPAPACCA